MSQLREIKLKIDLPLFERIATRKQLIVLKNAMLSRFSTEGRLCDLVVTDGIREIGITENGDVIYDDMDTRFVNDLLSSYVEEKLKEKGIPYRKVEDKRGITITIKR